MTPKETLQKAREQSDGWIESRGRRRPVPASARVTPKFRDGVVGYACEAGHLDWVHRDRDSEFDIVAYRLHTPSSPEPHP